jgi:outer membrane protein OmpA-like peptidoglycan-associated protein/tetratricopeptide (TPR) repeat protein
MKALYALPLCFILLTANVQARAGGDAKKKLKFDKAEQLLGNENYEAALPLYLSLDSADKDNANLAFKIGVCYLNSSTNKDKAVAWLEKAASNISENYKEGSFKEKHSPLTTYNYLGRAYHFNYQFDQAIAMFEKFKGYLGNNDPETLKEANRYIEMCNTGKELVASPVSMKVDNLGGKVNSPYSEHSPVITADEELLIFTSRRPTTTGGKIDPSDGKYFEDIYMCKRNPDSTWSEPVNMGSPINTPDHDATIGISVDGQKLFIYKDDKGDGNIYFSNLAGDHWAAPQKLNDFINSKSWEGNASISPDGNILYFSSEREGGLGGKDIYMSRKLPNGDWGKAMNLGPKINTPYDEDGAYIQADGVTLYFSSQGHKTMGGYDIFSSTFNPDSTIWSEAANMGYPVNSTDDDIFYTPTADNKRAYYSSFKKDGQGEKDIYMITLPERKETPLTVYKGTLVSIYGGVPKNAVITVTDNETGELVGTYAPNSSTGAYLFILQPGKNYNISYEADDFLFSSENFDVGTQTAYSVINKPIELAPIKVGQKITLKNIFFASGQSELKAESKVELEKLRALMTKMPNLVVEIGGHTDAQGGDDLNQRLSQKRAESVVKYLVDGGIDKRRLKAVGYGESQPIAINQNPDGSWNKQGMTMNRRFEFKILSVTGELLPDAVEKINVPDPLKPKDNKNK